VDIIVYGMADEALEKIKQLRIDLDSLDIDPEQVREVLAKAEQANINAINAVNTADNALFQANNAASLANTAKNTADGLASQVSSAMGKADTALAKATSAEIVANSANTKAISADSKAQNALDKANQLELDLSGTETDTLEKVQQALERANESHLIASNVKATYDLEIPTLRSDVATAKSKADTAKATADTAFAKAVAVESALNSLPTPTEGDITTDQLYNQVLITDAKANEAKSKADLAYDTANGVDSKAQSALDRVAALESSFAATANNAATAIQKATDAETTVNTLSIELTDAVNNALTLANQAKDSANLAMTTANGYASDIDAANLNASIALNTANEAKATADSVKDDLDTAVSNASTALTLATNANAKSDNAITRATAAESTANQAKAIAESIDSKATQAQADAATALTNANTAKAIAEGIDSKATQAQADAANALSFATMAKETAESIDAKATQAQTDAANALTVANEAKSIAEGIDGKATQAQTDAANAISTANSAKSSSDNAVFLANLASQVASAADDKAEEAILKANQSIEQFSQFSLKSSVQSRSDLPVDGNMIDDIRIVKDENKFYRYTSTGWIPIGIAEEEMATVRQLIDDMSLAASPYSSIKQRLDAIEGYIRQWSAQYQADFDRGTYDGTVFSGGVVLTKRMSESVNESYGSLTNTWTAFDLKHTAIPTARPDLLGIGGYLHKGYYSHMDYADLEALLSFTFHGRMQEVYFGFRMNVSMTAGYVISFKKTIGFDSNGNPYNNVIEIFKVTSTGYQKLTSLNYIFLDNQPYTFKLRMEGSNITVWRDTIKLIDISDSSYISGRLAFYDVSREYFVDASSQSLADGQVSELNLSEGFNEVQYVDATFRTSLGDYIITSNETGMNSYARISDVSDDLRTVTVDTPLLGAIAGEFNVGDIVLVHVSGGTDKDVVGNYGRFRVTSINGSSITLSAPITGIITKEQLPYFVVQLVKVPSFTNLTVNSGVTVSPVAYNGQYGGILAVDVTGVLKINGVFDASRCGYRQGDANPGVNGAIAPGQSQPANYGGGGGGGGANQFDGGNGGGSDMTGAGGVGGKGLGSIDLSKKMTFGGAGGGSSLFNWGSGYSRANGGTGGGIIYISCRVIDFGSTGQLSSHGQAVTVEGYAGAGGGAGGTIILHAPIIYGITNYTIGANGAGGGTETGGVSFPQPTNTGGGVGGSGYWNGQKSSGGAGYMSNGGGGGSQSATFPNVNGGNATATRGGHGNLDGRMTRQWAGGGGGGGGYIGVFTHTMYSGLTMYPVPVKNSYILKDWLALLNDGGNLIGLVNGEFQPVATLPLSDDELKQVFLSFGFDSFVRVTADVLKDMSNKGVMVYYDSPDVGSVKYQVIDKMPLELDVRAGSYTKLDGWYTSPVLDTRYLCKFSKMTPTVVSNGQIYNLQTRTFSHGSWSEWVDLNPDGTVLSPEGNKFQFRFYGKTLDGTTSPILSKVVLDYTISDKEVMDVSLSRVAEDLKQTKISLTKVLFHNNVLLEGQRQQFNNIVIERFDSSEFLEEMSNVYINTNGELVLADPAQDGYVILDPVALPSYSYYTMVVAEFEGQVESYLSYDYGAFTYTDMNSKFYNPDNTTNVRLKLVLKSGTNAKVLSAAVLV